MLTTSRVIVDSMEHIRNRQVDWGQTQKRRHTFVSQGKWSSRELTCCYEEKEGKRRFRKVGSSRSTFCFQFCFCSISFAGREIIRENEFESSLFGPSGCRKSWWHRLWHLTTQYAWVCCFPWHLAHHFRRQVRTI